MRALFLGLVLWCAAGAQALVVGGVQVAERTRVTAGGPELVLNGVGQRTIFLFRIYVIALYLHRRATP